MDTSYSGIVAKIQGDIEIGKQIICELSNQYFELESEINEAEKKLQALRVSISLCSQGIDHTIKHLKLELPLSIVTEEGIINISKETILLQKNVL